MATDFSNVWCFFQYCTRSFSYSIALRRVPFWNFMFYSLCKQKVTSFDCWNPSRYVGGTIQLPKEVTLFGALLPANERYSSGSTVARCAISSRCFVGDIHLSAKLQNACLLEIYLKRL